MQDQQLREITLRGILLGALVTIVFTTANVYLGLKVGLTFASSIPAAVFAITVFRFLGRNSILENNIVQTQVSAAGTLSATIFIIPSLFFVGYWNGFDFWTTFLICAGGGILGVLFTIPFRIELVEKNKLPYPEGIAAAEVLQLGEQKGQKDIGTKEMFFGMLLSSVSIFLSQGMRLIADGFGYFFGIGKAVFQIPFGFSLALIGAGWLVGLSVGIAILFGVVLAWVILVPIFSASSASSQDLATFAMQIWKKDVRFVGVGMIGVSAVWTFIKMLKPTFLGLRNSFKFSTKSRTQMDLPFKWVLGIFIVVVLVLLGVFYDFVSQANFSAPVAWSFVIVATFCAVLIGFLISATCGYMAGLVGSSSSPISGIGILGVVLLSLIVLGVAKLNALELDSQNLKFLIALSLFSACIVFAVATIANDNLQDLKTGMLVKATPWKQEAVLIIGCIVGASVIAPVLNLLYEAYGFVGHLPREGMQESNALNAPQAILMATIAEGIFKSTLNWLCIGIGIAFGIACIVLDFLLSQKKISLPPLAVGMGVYLPPIVTIPIFFGALLAHFAQKSVKQKNGNLADFKRKGNLMASGLIVGESLMGIVLAGIVVFSVSSGGDGEVLNFIAVPQNIQDLLGFGVFGVSLYLIYKRLVRV